MASIVIALEVVDQVCKHGYSHEVAHMKLRIEYSLMHTYCRMRGYDIKEETNLRR